MNETQKNQLKNAKNKIAFIKEMDHKIHISKNLEELPKIKLSEIHNIQGKLKTLDSENFDKLLMRIAIHGFKYPMYLWQHEGKFYNLDGNQRQPVISKTWGDTEIPYVLISAENLQAAKKEILAISSPYGKVSKDGYDKFSVDFDEIDKEEIQTEMTFNEWIEPDSVEEDEHYTTKVDTPTYNPTGEKPKYEELYNLEKYDQLLSEIRRSKLPFEEKEFLKLAATRHIEFNYRNIAEYYAHSKAETQNLIENSALVIIDYNKAIELGFVKLREEIQILSNE